MDEIRCVTLQRLPARLLDAKIQLRSKAQCSEYTKCILPEALIRIAHAAYQPPPEILPAAKQIHNFTICGTGHRINREIPAP